MWMTIGILSFLGLLVFIILAIIHAVKKTGKAKKMLLLSLICLVLMIIGISLSPDTKESADTEKKVTQKAPDETKKKEEAQKKAEAEAKKKAEQEAAAKKKAEEEAKLIAQNETPQTKLTNAITSALGEKSNREGKKITASTLDSNGNILVKFKGDENITENMTVTGIQMDISDALKAIQKSNVPYNKVNVITTYSMVDKFGNAKESDVINLTYSKATIDKINFDNFDRKNIYSIADTVTFVHPQFVPKK
jgi:apolipoprotein N-acyltransferase